VFEKVKVRIEVEKEKKRDKAGENDLDSSSGLTEIMIIFFTCQCMLY
jgi:hypothetical protein